MASGLNINNDPTRCELEFEGRGIQSTQRGYVTQNNPQAGRGNYGFAVQNYFPIQESWVKPYLLEEQLGIAISSAVAAPA